MTLVWLAGSIGAQSHEMEDEGQVVAQVWQRISSFAMQSCIDTDKESLKKRPLIQEEEESTTKRQAIEPLYVHDRENSSNSSHPLTKTEPNMKEFKDCAKQNTLSFEQLQSKCKSLVQITGLCQAKKSCNLPLLQDASSNQLQSSLDSFQALLEHNLLDSLRVVFKTKQIDQFTFIRTLQKDLNSMYCQFDYIKSICIDRWKEKIKQLLLTKSPQLNFELVKKAILRRRNQVEISFSTRLFIDQLNDKLNKILFGLSHLLIGMKSHLLFKSSQLVEKFNRDASKLTKISTQILQKISQNLLLVRKSVKKEIVACFSGYSRDSAAPSKQELAEIIFALGGKLASQGEFHDGITHVISPPNFPRTMRTLGASLLSKWIVSHDWLYSSQTNGYWVDEGPFGYRITTNQFAGKKFYLSQDFFRENEHYYNKDIFTTFFKRIVKAVIVTSMNDADYVMVSEDKASGTSFLSWNQFSELIDPDSHKTNFE